MAACALAVKEVVRAVAVRADVKVRAALDWIVGEGRVERHDDGGRLRRYAARPVAMTHG